MSLVYKERMRFAWLLALVASGCFGQAKIPVLIVDGVNNHDRNPGAADDSRSERSIPGRRLDVASARRRG
jgi:hypothetical protein